MRNHPSVTKCFRFMFHGRLFEFVVLTRGGGVQDSPRICACVRVCVCVYVCMHVCASLCVCACVCAFILYALNFDKYVFVENM